MANLSNLLYALLLERTLFVYRVDRERIKAQNKSFAKFIFFAGDTLRSIH
jgi:hypothetical protein